MLKSMTAFASLEKSDTELSVGIEMRAYNSRHLDVSLRLPPGHTAFEEKIKALIASRIERGRVEVRIWIKSLSEQEAAFEIDAAKAKAFHAAARSLKESLLLGGELTLEHLLSVPGIVQVVEKDQDLDARWPLIETGLNEALVLLDQMRRQEGDHIGGDFEQRLHLIETLLAEIEKGATGLPALYKEKLQARVEALTQGSVELDPVRIAQEVALLADRSDISEEIVRARSHIIQFRAIMQGAEPGGRKLNFLLQEFNREFNTMGSKVGQADLAHAIVAVKAEIEKMREQVQNIE